MISLLLALTLSACDDSAAPITTITSAACASSTVDCARICTVTHPSQITRQIPPIAIKPRRNPTLCLRRAMLNSL